VLIIKPAQEHKYTGRAIQMHTKNATIDKEKRTTNLTIPRKQQYKISNGEKKLYLFTRLSSVLLEKLTGSPLVKTFPAFYGTRKFIIALTSARHLSLS